MPSSCVVNLLYEQPDSVIATRANTVACMSRNRFIGLLPLSLSRHSVRPRSMPSATTSPPRRRRRRCGRRRSRRTRRLRPRQATAAAAEPAEAAAESAAAAERPDAAVPAAPGPAAPEAAAASPAAATEDDREQDPEQDHAERNAWRPARWRRLARHVLQRDAASFGDPVDDAGGAREQSRAVVAAAELRGDDGRESSPRRSRR